MPTGSRDLLFWGYKCSLAYFTSCQNHLSISWCCEFWTEQKVESEPIWSWCRYSFGALTAWVEKRQPGLRARGSVAAPGSTKNRRATSFDDSNRHDVSKPWSSVSDMLHHRKQPVKVATAAGVRPLHIFHYYTLDGHSNSLYIKQAC